MNMRVDIVSETTGRVLLSSLFDASPDGLTRKQCQQVIKVMAKTKRILEGVFGDGAVRISLDDYGSSVFWYLVLLRGINFDPKDPKLGKRTWSAYEMLLHPKLQHRLQQTDLGLVYDKEQDWLVLIWPEAVDGILKDFENCPSWYKILREQEQRTGEKPTHDFWKTCAASHSFIIPAWRLQKLGYLSKVLWHRVGIGYNDISVLDLAGIDIPKLDQQGKAVLPTAKRANFAHFYTDDQREFKTLKNRFMRDKHKREPRWNAVDDKRKLNQKLKRQRQKEERKNWELASRIISQLSTLLGNAQKGKHRYYISGKDAESMFRGAVSSSRMSGQESDWIKIERLLDDLENLLGDEHVPTEFTVWLKWRQKGAEALEA